MNIDRGERRRSSHQSALTNQAYCSPTRSRGGKQEALETNLELFSLILYYLCLPVGAPNSFPSSLSLFPFMPNFFSIFCSFFFGGRRNSVISSLTSFLCDPARVYVMCGGVSARWQYKMSLLPPGQMPPGSHLGIPPSGHAAQTSVWPLLVDLFV